MMKRGTIFAMILIVLFCLGFACAEEYTGGDFEYILLEDGTAEITDYTGQANVLEIPAQLDGHAVTSIGDSAFHGCSSLREITIPEGVISIGEHAFGACKALNVVRFPSSVTDINSRAFEGIYSSELMFIVYPGSIAEKYARMAGVPCCYYEGTKPPMDFFAGLGLDDGTAAFLRGE